MVINGRDDPPPTEDGWINRRFDWNLFLLRVFSEPAIEPLRFRSFGNPSSLPGRSWLRKQVFGNSPWAAVMN